MNLEDIQRIVVIGAGTMGQQIALQCALHSLEVTLYDVDAGALETAQKRIAGYASGMTKAGHLPQAAAEAALARIVATTNDAEAAHEADLLSESVPEDPELKGKVLAQFNALCPARTIFTTNTSTLLPSMFAAATGRPSQFAALHFHQPVWYSNVADVMGHPGTDPAVLTLLESFARRIGQIPIVLGKENSGYVFNTMLSALNRAAITLAAKGVASVEDVDRAWMGVMKTPLGPFGILDTVGIDTAWKITAFWADALDDAELRTNADWLKRYIDAGELGVKTGKGFYTYPGPAFERSDFMQGPDAG